MVTGTEHGQTNMKTLYWFARVIFMPIDDLLNMFAGSALWPGDM